MLGRLLDVALFVAAIVLIATGAWVPLIIGVLVVAAVWSLLKYIFKG